MTHDKLGGEDAAWLHMEDACNPMVVNAVVEFDGTLPLATLSARIEHRLLDNARFRERIVEPLLGFGLPHWELDPSFLLTRHLEHVVLPSADEDTVREFLGRAVSTLLDRAHPPWRIYAIDRAGAGTTLLFRFHHAIADGFALLGALLSLCDDGDAIEVALPKAAGGGVGLGRVAAALQRVVTLPPDPSTALKGSLGREKRVAWSSPIPLDLVKDVARREGATVNDILVAVATGALRRELIRGGADVAAVRAMVPINLRRTAARAALGNRFGLLILELPVGIEDPRARVVAVAQRMKALKATGEPIVTFALLRLMGWAPRAAELWAVSFFGKKASLVLTNVPGPRTRLTLGGLPATRVVFWVPQSGRMGLGLSIFSYAGEVTIGVIADARIIEDPRALATELDAEVRVLVDAR